MIYRLIRAFFRIFFAVLYRWKVIGLENIPDTGPVVLCSNHINNLDPMLVAAPLSRKTHFMAKAELFKFPPLRWLLHHMAAFPVKRGGVSKESIKLALQLLKDGNVMGIFPEGTRGGGMGKKGAAMLALRSNASVIPTAIVSEYRLFRPIVVLYGQPVDLSEFAAAGSDQMELATEKIMATIRGMVEQYKTGSFQ